MFGLLKKTLANLVSGPVTRDYPGTKRPDFDGSRGHLDMDPAVCIYCGACSKRCPTKAIAVSREPKEWKLEVGRCIVCGHCVEVCPKKCMWLDTAHGLARDAVQDARSGDSKGNS